RITGDNGGPARPIACAIGLVGGGDAAIDTAGAAVLTSPRFNELHGEWKALRAKVAPTEAEIRRREDLGTQLAGLRVLARAQPLGKYKMVELLQRRGEVVAVTGGGPHDAPAREKADARLSVGR